MTFRLRDVEGRAAAAQQEAESAGIELQDLQQRYRAEREASGQELADAQMDFQQALKGVVRHLYISVYLVMQQHDW